MWAFLLLFLASLSAISAQEDLQGKAFIFPQENYDGYVTLKSAQEEPLENFTICLTSFTSLIQDHVLFSYATKDQDRDILIYTTYQERVAGCVVFIGGEDMFFRVPDSYMIQRPLCITWDSETGVVALRIGRSDLARRVAKKGYLIGPDAVIALGVSWPPYAGRGFGGEIKDVYMWNVTLPMEDLRMTPWDCLSPSPIINWRSLQYEMKENVTLV